MTPPKLSLKDERDELRAFLDLAIPLHDESCEVRRWAHKLGFGPRPECHCENRDALRAEVEMLRGVGCMEDGDGPCGACVKCLRADLEKAKAEVEISRAESIRIRKALNDAATEDHSAYLEERDALRAELENERALLVESGERGLKLAAELNAMEADLETTRLELVSEREALAEAKGKAQEERSILLDAVACGRDWIHSDVCGKECWDDCVRLSKLLTDAGRPPKEWKP
jgi:hypothetical protein